MTKTLTDKVDALLETILYCDLRTNIGIDKAKKAIRLALKEQDRDSRHSAAEAVIMIKTSEQQWRTGFQNNGRGYYGSPRSNHELQRWTKG